MTHSATRTSEAIRRLREQGFTIFELLITLSVMSIVAAIALPRINLHQFRVDAGVRLVQSALQQGVRYAVQRQHDIYISFDVPGKRLLTVDDKNNNGAADAGEKVQWRQLEDGVRFAAPPAPIPGNSLGAVAGTNIKAINGLPSIIFRRDGAASTDLQVYITSTRPDAGDFKSLSVTRSTGHVDYYSYRAGRWVRGGA
jgi:prepilin-type N-terminal cleavage/methylation domain-containing protein